MNLYRYSPSLISITAALVLALLASPASSQGVALVTDVSGRVTGQAPVTILSELPADARVQVEPGGRLVVIYLKSGDEFAFTGPAQIQFRAAEPQVLSGAAPQRRSSPLGKGTNVTIKPVGVTQAAFVMRSSRPTARIKLLTLSGTKTLDASPEFRWQAVEPGVRYRFELIDDTGGSLHEAEVQRSSFKLPDSVQLREGVGYTWGVSARTPDGRRYVSAGDFSIATPQLRAEADVLRPGAGTPVSQRVAFAVWLEQMELKDEARKYWRALAVERPEDARLKALAVE
jgi:hypothetical protein